MDLEKRYQSIAASISDGSLSFPTSVGNALKIQQILDDPDCALDQAARLIQGEPLLAARVVATANSVAYNRSGREITDLRTAVSRLGFRTLRSLTMAVPTRQMAGNPSGETQKLIGQLWTHTAYVAAIAHLLARRVTHVDPEAALFAGVVHEVGGFYLLSLASQSPELIGDDHLPWLEGGEALIGRAVLEKIGVPANILEAIAGYWEGYLAIPPVSLADTLLLAKQLAPVPSPLRQPETSEAPALSAQIDMIVGEDMLSSILQDAHEEVSSLMQALQ